MNRKYFNLITIQFYIWFMFASHANKTENPKDFSFKIIQTTSEFNSKTGKYRRQYKEKDSTVNVKLDDKEIRKIQKLIVDLNFKNFPEKFKY